MRVRIHRGSHEVGGSCVEVEHRGDRVVLDVGKPLTAAWGEEVDLPDVPGLRDGSDPHLRGVLVTHPHLDHYGLIDQVSTSVPVYVGREASAVINASRFFNPAGPPITPAAFLGDRQPLRLGQFTITPHLVDHSGFDAYALVVDAGTERLLYTGDLRGHGRKSSLFERMLAHPPSNVDTLLMEGTHVARASGLTDAPARGVATESQLELEMAETFRATNGLPVVVSSAQNIDRLVTVYRACLRAGRTLLVDLYAASVVQAIGRPTIPQPGFPSLGVYVPNRQRVAVKTSGEFHRTRDVKAHRVYPEQIAAHSDRYVMVTSGSTISELLRCGALDSAGVVVWSLWSGYLREGSGKRLRTQLATAAVPLVEHHTSGHATVADLSRLAEAIHPRQVVPIHTDAPDQMASLVPNTTVVEDGEWWEVVPTPSSPRKPVLTNA